jgi:hypothetical protein
MPLPHPYPGLVIRYAYLWHRQYREGQEEGEKDRPCAIVLCQETEGDATEVFVVPITHSPPSAEVAAVEIPGATHRRLGLDNDRSWVIVSETNRFFWPGPDVRPITEKNPGSFEQTDLPPNLFVKIRDLFVKTAKAQRLRLVRRSE